MIESSPVRRATAPWPSARSPGQSPSPTKRCSEGAAARCATWSRRHALQKDALGVLMYWVEIAASIETGKGASEAEVRDHHDQSRVRLQPAVVAGETSSELGAAALLLYRIVGDLYFSWFPRSVR